MNFAKMREIIGMKKVTKVFSGLSKDKKSESSLMLRLKAGRTSFVKKDELIKSQSLASPREKVEVPSLLTKISGSLRKSLDLDKNNRITPRAESPTP